MALDDSKLTDAIIAGLESAGFTANPQSRVVWAIIAKAIIDHIKTNAEVKTIDSRGDSGTGTIK